MKVASLWVLLAQATQGAAAVVVQRYERNGFPNGPEAWLEPGQMYEEYEADERPMPPLALEGDCRIFGVILKRKNPRAFLVKPDAIWSEFERPNTWQHYC